MLPQGQGQGQGQGQIRFMTPHSPSGGKISETFNLEESRNFTSIMLRNFFLPTTWGSY